VAKPFNDLLFEAHTVRHANFDPNRIQLSQLLSIKTGGCGENCGYCGQSAHHHTGLDATKLLDLDQVLAEAEKAARLLQYLRGCRCPGGGAEAHPARPRQPAGIMHFHRPTCPGGPPRNPISMARICLEYQADSILDQTD
jgi:hypothetical protein